MNNIRQLQELNKRELENGVSPEASWHRDFSDTAFIYIGGLPFELSEGDIITIFSQFGEPTYVNLVRDKETGKSKGFAFLKYEDQRSTDLAVDNLGGTTILNRILRVDHTRYKKDDEQEEGQQLLGSSATRKAAEDERSNGAGEEERPVLQEERDLEVLMRDHDDDDPMKPFLIREKKQEIATALSLIEAKHSIKDHRKRHHRHRPHGRDSSGDRTKSRTNSRRGRGEHTDRRVRSIDRNRDRGSDRDDIGDRRKRRPRNED